MSKLIEGLSNPAILFSAAGRVPGTAPGTGIAAVATTGYFGFLVGPPVIGLVSQAFGGLRAGLSLVALLGVGIAVLAGQLRGATAGPHAASTPVAEAGADL